MKHYLEITLFLIGWCGWVHGELRGAQVVKPRGHIVPRATYTANRTRDPNKKHDPIYYSTSYYSSSDYDSAPKFIETATILPEITEANPVTTVPPPPTTNTQVDVAFDFEDLSDAAFATVVDPKAEKADRDAAYKMTNVVWKQIKEESSTKTNDHNHKIWFRVMCHQLGVTFFNAKSTLRNYYRIRYAYYNKKEFELGYVVQEIIHKYTVLLELFHIVQQRYYNVTKYRDVAPSTYMLYMYTVILEQAQQIMHYCDVLSQIEKKYEAQVKKKMKGRGISEQDDDGDAGNDEEQKKMAGEVQRQIQLEEEHKKRLIKLQKKRLRQQKKEERESGRYYSTRRTKSPRSWGRWPHHYGWSFENW